MTLEQTEVPGADGVYRLPARFDWLWPWAVFLLALFARMGRVAFVVNPIDDSRIHVLTGLFYFRDGLLYPDGWWTPPLKHLITKFAMVVLGNDLLGWRMKNVILGAVLVYLVYWLCRRLFRNELVALVASTLLALDPLSVGLSRTTHEDLSAMCFAVLGLLFLVRGLEREDRREWEWVLSGVAFGLGIALRWYVVFPMIVAAIGALWANRRRFAEFAAALAAFTFVPVNAYVLSYVPWFRRGHGLAEWLTLQRDALAIQGPRFLGSPEHLQTLAGPGRWFVAWVGRIGSSNLAGPMSGTSALFNDPVLWALFVPSAILLLVAGIRGSRVSWAVVGAAFLASYGFMIISPRPIVLYSAMAVVPLGFICVGFAAVALLRRRAWWFLAAGLAWSLYLYPLVAGYPLWSPAYSWLMAVMA